MRGRELKSDGVIGSTYPSPFALMRGRELKCVDAIYYGVLGSPSCEGGS